MAGTEIVLAGAPAERLTLVVPIDQAFGPIG